MAAEYGSMMSHEEDPAGDGCDDSVGYGKPPNPTRFQKGQSGNPAGRTRGRRHQAPYAAVLERLVTIREDGEERQVTAAQAFLLKLKKDGLEGNAVAARAAFKIFDKIRELRPPPPVHEIRVITRTIVKPANVTQALIPLRMAKKFDPYRETARVMLEPWVVEAGLARIEGTISAADQRTILNATRTPHKVRWPAWWSELP